MKSLIDLIESRPLKNAGSCKCRRSGAGRRMAREKLQQSEKRRRIDRRKRFNEICFHSRRFTLLFLMRKYLRTLCKQISSPPVYYLIPSRIVNLARCLQHSALRLTEEILSPTERKRQFRFSLARCSKAFAEFHCSSLPALFHL